MVLKYMSKNNINKIVAPVISFLILFGVFFVLSHKAHACNEPGGVPCNQPGDVTVNLVNPINVDNFGDLVAKILDIVLVVGVPIVAFFLIYSGFLFVIARGNQEGLETAKRNFLYTIIGAVLLLGAWVLANAISGTVDALKTP